MSFDDDESSVAGSLPREFYSIVQSGLVTYRVASGTRDIDYDGHTYAASPIARTEISVDHAQQQQQLTLALPLNHGLCQRWLTLGVPPRAVDVTVYRKQLTSGVVERIAGGLITSMAIEKHLGKFLIQSQFARFMQRRLPVIKAGRLCPHILYDVNCRVDRTAFTHATTVAFVDGRQVVLAALAEADHWADLGEVVHVASGERMTVVEQLGTVCNMQAPIPGLNVGDAVTVSAGCLHDVGTCNTKYGNQVNFGGFPQLPTGTVFQLPTGYGVIEQT